MPAHPINRLARKIKNIKVKRTSDNIKKVGQKIIHSRDRLKKASKKLLKIF